MKHIVVLCSFVASLITIGDLCIKLFTGREYDYLSSILWIVVVIGIQIAFSELLDLNYSDSGTYVVVLFALLVPICLASGYTNYHNLVMTANLPSDVSVVAEITKTLFFFILTVSLPIAWSKICESYFLREPTWLALMFALPCLLITALGLSRYILSNLPLDRFFFGYVLLIAAAPGLAAFLKSQCKR